MTDYFRFDGVSSKEFNAYVFDSNTHSTPQKDFTAVTVPGRSGDLLWDNKRFPNVIHTYWVLITRYFEDAYAEMRGFLLSRKGYCRLEDTFHRDEFYQAYYNQAITPIITRTRDMGKFQVTFIRKPQRWLIIGEDTYSITGSSSVTVNDYTNPTYFESKPMLEVTGSIGSTARTVQINDINLTIKAPSGSSSVSFSPLYIDCDTMEAYTVNTSTGLKTYYNNWITITGSNDFPTLTPGANNIVKPTGISSLVITPRWYTL